MVRNPHPPARPRRRRPVPAAGLALALALAAPALPQGDVPRELQPWIPWVLAEHPDLACPLVSGVRLCAWPGRLELVLDARGGRFTLDVEADRELDLPLPGDALRWPREVTDRGAAALMRRRGDRPAVRLAPGRHRLAGSFSWNRLPESLPLPPEIALVDLTVAGRPVLYPRRDGGGLLWLEGARAEEAAEDRLDLEVQRHVEDGVPVVLTLRLALRVSGQGREVDLGRPLPEGFEPISLVGGLPVRLGEGGELLVQLRPGEWELQLVARSVGPVTGLTLGERPDPWPREEIWVFEADLATRSVKLSGAPAIDPRRTSLPEAWRDLPAFRLTAGTTLAFEELRRGEAAPPPDAVTASRSWWLAEDGRRFTLKDRLDGILHQGGRLEVLPPAELGRVALGEDGDAEVPQVITVAPEGGGEATPRAGVEVRRGALRLAADLTYRRGGALPAVGWNRDVQSLDATLHLPPGWTLLAAPGVDRAGGSWVDRWSLLDLFLLLILTLATWKLDGRPWGLVALALLGAGWYEPHAAALWAWWIALVPLRALGRVLPEGGRAARALDAVGVVVLIGFAVQLLVFCASQFRTGLFPQLEHGGRGPYDRGVEARASGMRPPLAMAKAEAIDVVEETEPAPQRRAAPMEQKVLAPQRQQVAPDAVVQTGPGVPRWGWTTCRLEWSGPVAADHRLRLWLISPALELLLSLLRIAAAVAIAWRIFGQIFGRGSPPGGEEAAGGRAPAAAAGILLLFAAGLFAAAPRLAAQEEPAAPSSNILAELERRLTVPPECHPDCVEVPRLALEARGDELVVVADVHAAAPSAWRLPGPADVWSPTRVTVDGARTVAGLRRGPDGFLLLRLRQGAHRLELRGPARESVALQFPLRPRTFSWRGTGWTIAGYRPDAPPPSSVRLDRQQALAGPRQAEAAVEPWLELTRVLDIGIPWMVHNELKRHGPSGPPVLVRVPLLAGESVTTPGVTVTEGEAEIALERGETVRRWRSTLEETEAFTLIAPADRPWLERWELDCSPVWNCLAEGLPPVRHMEAGSWRPRWQPWPGDGLTFRFVRPAAAAGATATIDAAELHLAPGRRLLEGRLEIDLRSSRGGEHRFVLPPDAALQSFTVDGQPRPAPAAEGGLSFTVEPGRHRVVAEWRQPHRLGILERSPAVELDGAAVNVGVTVEVPENRWLLWTGGPDWGPVVTMWEYLLILALAAWCLGRYAPTPLAAGDWFLLGAGMTQVPLAAPVVVVLWLLFLALRERLPGRRWWSWDLQQLALLALSLAALIALWGAIQEGLLVQPDMQVAGAGSYGSTLNWYADRVDGALPRPWILWLPLWVWRVLMLLWALWLAARLLRWLPWCWERFAAGPILAGPKSFRRHLEGEGDAEGAQSAPLSGRA